MFMSSLSIEVLKEIIEVAPDDFEVGFKKNDIYSPIGKVEIDAVDKRVVLNRFMCKIILNFNYIYY